MYMKYLSLLLILLASCSKKNCYTCTEIRTDNFGSYSTTTTNHCDWLESDARKFESLRTKNVGGITYRCSCTIVK